MTTVLFRFSQASASGRTIFGLAMPYGVVAEVDDGWGPYKERFEFGAFARSIAERGSKVKLFAQHDQRRLPLGNASLLEEQADGLHAAFSLPRTSAGDDALELVRSGVVGGFSVGFIPLRDRSDGDVTVRVEASLREISLTHAPAYAEAAIAGVRSLAPRLTREAARRRLALIDRSFR